jgi:hypothetical protein
MGLLNGVTLFPRDSTIKGDGALPTPIAVAASEIQVLGRGEDGTVQILSRRLDQVCPVGADACGIVPSFAVTGTTSFAGSADLDGIISPTRDRMVVVERSGSAHGVFVVRVASPTPAPAQPTPRSTGDATPPAAALTQAPGLPSATASPAGASGPASPPTDTPPATEPPTATPDVSVATGPTPPPTATPAVTATTSPDVSPSAGPDASASPSASPSATPEGSPEPATPSPTVAVSPAPDGALEIARNVIVIGGLAAYSPDGSHFAFTARPADGSAGPDVFSWSVGDPEAHALTTDHASVFAGWLDGRLLVSRIKDGVPGTVLLGLEGGAGTAVGTASAWRPAVGPERRTAVSWDGTVVPAADGVTPVPGEGRLVLAPWPDGSVEPQVLSTGPLADWDVHWDEAGSVLAVWTTTGAPGEAGHLSLYRLNQGTGLANLAHPLLDAAPAFEGFSLHEGRLVWSAPADGGDSTVQVLAWSGSTVGRLELPTERGTTVVR